MLVLSGNNSYSGGTTINSGTLRVTNNNSVGIGIRDAVEARHVPESAPTRIVIPATCSLPKASARSITTCHNMTLTGAALGASIVDAGTVSKVGAGLVRHCGQHE